MLNHEEIGKNTERITKIEPYINKNKQERINFPLQKNNWKKFDKNNATLALNPETAKYVYTFFKHRLVFAIFKPLPVVLEARSKLIPF